jgi:cell division protein FtsB
MVTRKRLRAFLTGVGLYLGAGLFVGYFAVNAYTGDRGLKAKQDLDAEIATLTGELDRLKRERLSWERRVALLQAERLDPDMLDERARAHLGVVHPHDLVLMLR